MQFFYLNVQNQYFFNCLIQQNCRVTLDLEILFLVTEFVPLHSSQIDSITMSHTLENIETVISFGVMDS